MTTGLYLVTRVTHSFAFDASLCYESLPHPAILEGASPQRTNPSEPLSLHEESTNAVSLQRDDPHRRRIRKFLHKARHASSSSTSAASLDIYPPITTPAPPILCHMYLYNIFPNSEA